MWGNDYSRKIKRANSYIFSNEKRGPCKRVALSVLRRNGEKGRAISSLGGRELPSVLFREDDDHFFFDAKELPSPF